MKNDGLDPKLKQCFQRSSEYSAAHPAGCGAWQGKFLETGSGFPANSIPEGRPTSQQVEQYNFPPVSEKGASSRVEYFDCRCFSSSGLLWCAWSDGLRRPGQPAGSDLVSGENLE